METTVYACKNKDSFVRAESTSGGVFTLLAEYVLGRNGAVFGVIFDDNWSVRFFKAVNRSELSAIRGSKYPQAYMGDTLRLVKQELMQGREVLFVGTPCQVAGLKSFLGKEYGNLLCVDFICLGVGSPKLWDSYLKENFYQEHIREIKFKDKRAGWHRFTTVIKTDGREVAVPGPKNPYMQSYLSGNNVRPSCYSCGFKGKEGRNSDLTISDSWGIEKSAPEFDDDKGVSNVFINTTKGADVFGKIQEGLNYIQIAFPDAIKSNPYYFSSVANPPRRSSFWNAYQKSGFTNAMKKTSRHHYVKRKLAALKKILIKNKEKR